MLAGNLKLKALRIITDMDAVQEAATQKMLDCINLVKPVKNDKQALKKQMEKKR